MKKTTLPTRLRTPLVLACGIIAFLMFSRTHCGGGGEDEPYPPEPYSPSFTVHGVKYSSAGYYFLYFDLICTTDAIEITTLTVTGPFGTGTYSGGGEVFNQNQSIFIYDEDRFLYAEGKYTFTIKGVIRSGSHSGESFTKSTSWELIIP